MGAIPVGRLNCEIPAGVLLGPNSTNELLVSWGPDGTGGSNIGYATTAAVNAAGERCQVEGPASVAEAHIVINQQRELAARQLIHDQLQSMYRRIEQERPARPARRGYVPRMPAVGARFRGAAGGRATRHA